MNSWISGQCLYTIPNPWQTCLLKVECVKTKNELKKINFKPKDVKLHKSMWPSVPEHNKQKLWCVTDIKIIVNDSLERTTFDRPLYVIEIEVNYPKVKKRMFFHFERWKQSVLRCYCIQKLKEAFNFDTSSY